MKRKLIIFVLLVAVISLSACIYIPKPGAESEPYEDVNPTTIHIGETTRSEIVDLLGQPLATRKNDLVWIYFGKRTTGLLINPNPFSFPYNLLVTKDLQAAVIVFENDVVQKYEIIEHFDDMFLPEHPSCTSFGICLTVWEDTFSPDSIVTSKGNDDKQAKQFQSLSNKCSLYIYNTDSHRHKNSWTATIGSVNNVEFGLTGYINLLLKPGRHKLTINISTNSSPKEQHTAEKNITCTSGTINFTEVYRKRWPWNRRIIIGEVDESSGRKAIKKRDLILMP